MLDASGLSRAFGSRTLFADVTLRIADGDRIGLVGPNGSGKTTLLRILAGIDAPDDGRVRLRKGARLGYLRQEIDLERPRTVFEEASSALAPLRALEQRIRDAEAEISRRGGDGQALPESLVRRYDALGAEFERAGGFEAEAQLRAILTGLGFGPEQWRRPLRELAGGRLMRLELVKLLAARAHLLLLDEPTNHLDLPSIAWFESFLSGYPGAVVVVSHDRAFLDRHVTRIAELRDGRLEEYRGNYSAYERLRLQRGGERSARARNLGREIAAQQRFVDRFGAKATKARQAQSRKKRLERLREQLEALPREREAPRMRARFEISARSGERVFHLTEVAKSYAGVPVYSGLELSVSRGERVALVGPNGAGKSTLLRLLAGALQPDSGRVETGHGVRAALYDQHRLDALDPRKSVLEQLAEHAADADFPRLRGLLGAFLFSGSDVDKRVGVLSGGEKARLSLAQLSLSRANALLLDEPTNHLDIEGLDVLTGALADYPGTLVAISHDRRFLNALCTRVVEVTPAARGSRVRSFAGGYDDYARRLESESAEAPAAEPAPRPRPRGRARPRPKARLRELHKRGAEIETRIEAAEASLQEIDGLFAQPGLARDGERMRELQLQRRDLLERAAELYAEWERIGERVAELEADPDPAS